MFRNLPEATGVSPSSTPRGVPADSEDELTKTTLANHRPKTNHFLNEHIMSLEQQQAQSPEQTENEATELSNNLRLRSRTSTTTTTSSTASNSKNELPLTTTMTYTTTSSLPSPVIPQPTPKPQKSSRGGARKSNKSTRRSSVNQKKENSSKKKSNSPPILPNNPAQQHQQQEQTIPEDDANITRCVCGEDNEEANDVIMFQCDKCSVWQHGPCVGLYAEFPGDYFCEKCRPDLHTTGQYQKSTSHQPTRRSPSFTSSSSRRERVNPDAASLAAFLTDAGVKPEDQLSLGGFALPTFAQTRRQSNMLVDGVVPLAQKKQTAMDTSSSGTAESTLLPSAVNDLNKAKRKRPSLDQIESPILSVCVLSLSAFRATILTPCHFLLCRVDDFKAKCRASS
ncbi:hypothetical protein PGT21_023537 [Puccinia graminis f. sp. tritici]|uniref:Zinc finger PHD-type domain-containing protein n=1 Tax=Puccinia graminis f. sp. tritici TaxID=56615 RepID=A0A5B0MS22_PUCGR|nr:hypothetical protein PGT21_023537 [Puccinia graminis f. sp. tritici]